jgi:DNA-binding winged helix-turn-helix (wHTH) protein
MPHGPCSFGPFRLDPAERRLTRDGAPVEVSARYLDALILLVAEQGSLVTKDRFMDEVWRGVPVTDEALTQCIRALRRALGDDAANPRFIETVPRFGYRFIAAPAGAPQDSPTRALPARSGWIELARVGGAAALGGGMAGIAGALAYVAAGLVAPGIGAASTLLVLVSVNLLLGLAGGLFVGAGIALASRQGRTGLGIVLGAGAGGLLVGAIARTVGSDLLTLFFGRAPQSITGALEGLVLGGATGFAAWLALRPGPATPLLRVGPAPAIGALAGVLIALAGGRLMLGSLASLAREYPQSNLRLEGLSSTILAAATALECALFAGCVVAALLWARRLASRD